jgi:hypothetical protein
MSKRYIKGQNKPKRLKKKKKKNLIFKFDPKIKPKQSSKKELVKKKKNGYSSAVNR